MRPGEIWGRPTDAAPDLVVEGHDADLASAVTRHPGALVRFDPAPGSDVARGVGARSGIGSGWEVPMDVLLLPGGRVCVNAVVIGTPPDRLRPWSRSEALTLTVDGRARPPTSATSVVIATGQYLRGLDLVPRSHPGDGRAEAHAYALRPGERASMRRRLPQGRHVPHPRIHTATGRRIEVAAGRPAAIEIDGVACGEAAAHLDVRVLRHHFRLLV